LYSITAYHQLPPAYAAEPETVTVSTKRPLVASTYEALITAVELPLYTAIVTTPVCNPTVNVDCPEVLMKEQEVVRLELAYMPPLIPSTVIFCAPAVV
jgi:hypothetical protein